MLKTPPYSLLVTTSSAGLCTDRRISPESANPNKALYCLILWLIGIYSLAELKKTFQLSFCTSCTRDIPSNQACALMRNETGYPSCCRLKPNQLSHALRCSLLLKFCQLPAADYHWKRVAEVNGIFCKALVCLKAYVIGDKGEGPFSLLCKESSTTLAICRMR